jgi:hypothetical protein
MERSPSFENIQPLARMLPLPWLVEDLFPKETARDKENGTERQRAARKTAPQPLRLAFANERPRTLGDNCLLTMNFGFVDLAFPRLLA